MSDEESFVILGSTPTPSMEAYSSMNDTVKKSATNEKKCDSFVNDPESLRTQNSWYTKSNDSILVDPNRSINVKDSILAEKSPPKIESIRKTSNQQQSFQSAVLSADLMVPKSFEESSLPETIADKYLLGKINETEMKMHMSSQFPSFFSKDKDSLEIDTKKLQQLMVDYATCKDQLLKVNISLNDFLNKIEVGHKTLEEKHKQEIEKIRSENAASKLELEKLIEALKVSTDTERIEIMQEVSEGKSVMRNISAKLERIDLQQNDMSIINPDQSLPIDTTSRDLTGVDPTFTKIKNLERQLSQVLAENLEIKDMKSIYIDEINTLKVNLTAASELLRKAEADISLLKAQEVSNRQRFAHYEEEKVKVQQEVELLRQQLELYKADFEMERNARQELAGQKDQLLTDLKLLQRRNQQLIEENEKRSTSIVNSPRSAPSNRQSTPEQMYTSNNFICPICNKLFSTLGRLEHHVQTCLTD